MRRHHLLEFNDQPWLPERLRSSITETLGDGLRSSRLFAPLAPVFVRFLRQAGTREVLDLCSGSGEPMSSLLDALQASGESLPSVVLSDLFPNSRALHAVARRHPGRVLVADSPVDALAVPARFHGRARTIVNALHHFPPVAVGAMLQDCARSRSAIFVVESFPRSVPGALRLAPVLAAALLRNPLRAAEHRVTKGLLTWLLPVLPAMGAVDLVVSAMRIHELQELHAMTSDLHSAFRWEGGMVPYRGRDQVLYFLGVPRP